MAGSKASYSYIGKAIAPTVKVTMFGRTLVRDNGFAVSYKNNVKVGTGAVTVGGKVTAAGNSGYKSGSKTAVFKVRVR